MLTVVCRITVIVLIVRFACSGYYVFVVTTTHLYLFQSMKDVSITSANSWRLVDLHAVLHLNDPASFFAADDLIAQATRHIRVHITDQVASPVPILDFYSFYEDSSLYYHLQQAWQQSHTRRVLPIFYPDVNNAGSGPPMPRSKISKLSKLAVQALYMHQEAMLLATMRDAEDVEA